MTCVFTTARQIPVAFVNGEEIQNKEYCGDGLAQLGSTAVRYFLVDGININTSQAELLINGKVNYGGIDLTKPYQTDNQQKVSFIGTREKDFVY